MTRLLPVQSPVRRPAPEEERPSSPKSPIQERTFRAASPTFDSASEAQFSLLDFQTQSEPAPEASFVEDLSPFFPEPSKKISPFKNESAPHRSLLVDPEPKEEIIEASSRVAPAVSKRQRAKEENKLCLLTNRDWIAAVKHASDEPDTKMKGILIANNFGNQGLFKIFKEHVGNYRDGSLRFPE